MLKHLHRNHPVELLIDGNCIDVGSDYLQVFNASFDCRGINELLLGSGVRNNGEGTSRVIFGHE
jgi:hypothetical protein